MSRLLNEDANMGGIIGGAIGIIGLIALSMYLLRKTFDRIDRSTQDSENIVLQRRRLQRHTVPYDRNIIRQQIESAVSASRTPEEEKERKEREAYIIDKLIHKASIVNMYLFVDVLFARLSLSDIPMTRRLRQENHLKKFYQYLTTK